MLAVEQIYNIRKMHNLKKWSIRKIAKITGHDRGTIKKYVEKTNFNIEPPVKQTRKRKTDAYREEVKQWLIDDEKRPRKQRHTAHLVYTRLKEKYTDFDISERSIRSLVAELRTELLQQEMVALPLLKPAGEAQADFGDTTFYEQGIKYEGHHFCLTFPHSDAKYVQLFKGENFECLATGLANIFTHVGGVPTTIRFDNMSTAVKKIKAGGGRELTESFKRMQCHFGFTSNFCNPESGHEKGSVENFVGTSRRNFFVPLPEMTDLVAYNQELLTRCDDYLEREHYKHERLVRDLFQEDQECFLSLPDYRFDACRYVPARTDNYGFAKFNTNRYSTAGHLRRCDVTLKVSAYTIDILDEKMQLMVSHPRLYSQNKESMIWSPYLDVLAKRPMAMKYSGFYEALPGPVKLFLDNCNQSGRQQILQLLAQESRTVGLDLSLNHLVQAIDLKPRDVDALLSAYSFIVNKPGQMLKNPVPEHLPATPEYKIDLGVYSQLMGGSVCQEK